jgi:hypothetical protein
MYASVRKWIITLSETLETFLTTYRNKRRSSSKISDFLSKITNFLHLFLIKSTNKSDDVCEQNSWAALWARLTGQRTWPTNLTAPRGFRSHPLVLLIDILFLPKKEKILFVPSALDPKERRRRRPRGRRRRSAALLSTRRRWVSREGILA